MGNFPEPITPDSLTWMRPYAIESKRIWLFWWFHAVVFDEDARVYIGTYEECKQVRDCLNGAYNLGRYQEKLDNYLAENG